MPILWRAVGAQLVLVFAVALQPSASAKSTCNRPTLNITAFPDECTVLRRACVFQQTIVTFDPDYQDKALPEIPFERWNFPSGLSNSDALYGQQPWFRLTFRRPTALEPPELRQPIFSNCTTPLVLMHDWAFNVGEFLAEALTMLHAAFFVNKLGKGGVRGGACGRTHMSVRAVLPGTSAQLVATLPARGSTPQREDANHILNEPIALERYYRRHGPDLDMTLAMASCLAQQRTPSLLPSTHPRYPTTYIPISHPSSITYHPICPLVPLQHSPTWTTLAQYATTRLAQGPTAASPQAATLPPLRLLSFPKTVAQDLGTYSLPQNNLHRPPLSPPPFHVSITTTRMPRAPSPVPAPPPPSPPDRRLTLVYALPEGLGPLPFHRQLLAPFTQLPVVPLWEVGRAQPGAPADWAWEGTNQSCFEEVRGGWREEKSSAVARARAGQG